MSSSKSSSSSSAGAPHCYPEHLRDVVCRVDVILGTGSVSVRECLGLSQGSVVRLAQAAGSNVQVLVNGIAVANAEVVMMDDVTSIRLTEVLAPPSSSAA